MSGGLAGDGKPCGCSPADACGCCGPVAEPPRFNLPGAPALRYRIGTHASFLARMLERLPFRTVEVGGAPARPLAALTTRDSSDPSIAVLDAWAVLGDILSFYQERIANEGFLGTATERRSLHELAAAVGYELKPGVAAGTYLAFNLDPPAPPLPPPPAPQPPMLTPTPTEIRLEAGTKAQSVPGPGELPQTFETVEAITAKVAWNALRARQSQRQRLGVDDADHLVWTSYAGTSHPTKYLWLSTTTANLNPGDRLVVRVTAANRDPNDTALVPISATPVTLRVVATEVDQAAGRTRVELDQVGGAAPPGYALPARPPGTVVADARPLDAEAVRADIIRRTWSEADLAAQLAARGWNPERVLAQVAAVLARLPSPASVLVQRKSAGVFGAAAPPFGTLPESVRTGRVNWDTSEPSVWQRESRALRTSADLYLDRVVDGLVAGGWAVLTHPGGAPAVFRIHEVVESSLAEFALSGKATGLRLRHPDGTPLSTDYKLGAGAVFKVRSTTVLVGSEALPVGTAPIDRPVGAVSGATGAEYLVLDGMVLGLRAGQVLAVAGTALDEDGGPIEGLHSELAVVSNIQHRGGTTVVHFEEPLGAVYERATLTLSANVARATHGETVANEIMGSSDGTVRNQSFALKRPPLTLVSAPTSSGTATTLEVRVDGVAWREVPTLLGAGADARVYQVRTDSAGKSMVTFGDGRQGARPPTGRDNVTASYRTGIGLAGQVKAGSLTILGSRPLGLRGVINPEAAGGAEDPEPTAAARRNAPRTVRTLDRIVSLSDYADFAQGFAGIGKARGVAVWDGDGRLVHVTVAGVDGKTVDTTSDLYRNLVKAVSDLGDGIERFAIGSFTPRQFALEATLTVGHGYRPADVWAAAQAATRRDYAFEARELAQPVTEAEVVTGLLAVPGVAVVRVTALHRTDQPGAANAVIAAADARWDTGTRKVEPAELLVLLPTSLRLSMVTT